MGKNLRKGIAVSLLVCVAFVVFGVIHDRYRNNEVRQRQAEIWAHEGALVDACDAAYGQGVLAKRASLADEAKLRYTRSDPLRLIPSEGNTTVVVLVQGKQVCRVDNTTYKVLEKL